MRKTDTINTETLLRVIQSVSSKKAEPFKYWNALKKQLVDQEGFSELSSNMGQLKLPATDGKLRETDVANMKTVLRIIQSIPSKNAEPFKQWLAPEEATR
jgi:DNA-damage-inducible protein D